VQRLAYVSSTDLLVNRVFILTMQGNIAVTIHARQATDVVQAITAVSLATDSATVAMTVVTSQTKGRNTAAANMATSRVPITAAFQ